MGGEKIYMMTSDINRKSVHSGKMKPELRKMKSLAGEPVTFNSITYGKNNNANLDRKRGKCLKLSGIDNFRRWNQVELRSDNIDYHNSGDLLPGIERGRTPREFSGVKSVHSVFAF